MILTPFFDFDIPDIVRICSSDNVNKYLFKLPIPYLESDAANFVKTTRENYLGGNIINWAVRLIDVKNNYDYNKLIASIEYRKKQTFDNIGIWLDEDFSHQGFAFEALICVINWVRSNINDYELIYSHHIDNEASESLILRLVAEIGGKYIKISNSSDYNIFDRNKNNYQFKSYKID